MKTFMPLASLAARAVVTGKVNNKMTKVLMAAVAATVAMSAGGGAQAAVQSYDCTFDSKADKGWIPDRVLLSLDAEAGKARAFDGYIKHAHEKPIDVKFKEVRGKYRMSWKLPLPSRGSGKVRVNYTVTLTPGSNDFRMKASFPLRNAANLLRGAGSCKLIKGDSLY